LLALSESRLSSVLNHDQHTRGMEILGKRASETGSGAFGAGWRVLRKRLPFPVRPLKPGPALTTSADGAAAARRNDPAAILAKPKRDQAFPNGLRQHRSAAFTRA